MEDTIARLLSSETIVNIPLIGHFGHLNFDLEYHLTDSMDLDVAIRNELFTPNRSSLRPPYLTMLQFFVINGHYRDGQSLATTLIRFAAQELLRQRITSAS